MILKYLIFRKQNRFLDALIGHNSVHITLASFPYRNSLNCCRFLAIISLCFIFIPFIFSQTTQTFTTTGSFIVPATATSIKVECWGGGGAGGGNTVNISRGGGGGAGGSYASSILPVVVGNSYTVNVAATVAGINGVGAKGNPSWFGTTTTIYAEGGNGGAAANNATVAGGAGSIAQTIGTLRYAGGNGANGTTTVGGAAGGGAGSTGVGGNASGVTAGIGKTIGGGNGGIGYTLESNGANGSNYGGGGGGAYIPDNTNHRGGNGAAGQVIVSWITISTTATETCIGGSTGTITVTVTGGDTPYNYTINGGTAQSSNVFGSLAAGNYTIVATDNNGLKATETVTINSPFPSTDNQNAAGTDSWIGHMYDGVNFDTYYGRFTESMLFNESFGGSTNCFSITSNSITRSIYTETFSVRYRMNSTLKGLYVVNLGSDDGSRLIVDGITVYNNWNYQAYSSKPRVLFSLTGNSSIAYEFFENGGGNQVAFEDGVLILENNLSNNLTQNFNVSTTGAAISGDVFSTLPVGITLSGTGYQWTYSTTTGGTRIPISGATSATFTPNTSVAPFNVPGTYYIFRNAVLTSTNNVAPNPYVQSNESNYATLVVNPPSIAASKSTISGFSYVVNNGPSDSQSFTVSGSNLGANLTVTPSANYEVSTTLEGTYFSTLNLTPSAGSVPTTTIYVRLKGGLAGGTYNSQNIVCSSSNTTSVNVACSGTVYAPLITTSVSSLTGYSYPLGFGPSAEKSYTVSGTSLLDNITLVAGPNFEISTGTGASFVPGLVKLIVVGGVVNTTSIYVRMKSGLPLGSVASENIVITSADAATKTVANTGTVVAPPAITTSAISGNFTYVFGAGPSAQRTFTVSGTNLTGDILVTAPQEYEISRTNGSNFVTTPITIIRSGTSVPTTTVYVRLKAGVGVGTFASDIVVSSANASSSNVAISGTVTSSSTIFNAISFLSGFIYRLGTGPSGDQSFVVKAIALTANVTVTAPTNFEISKNGTTFASTITLNRVGTILTQDTIVYVRMKSGLVVGDYGPLNSNVVLTSGGAITKSIACTGKVVAANTRTILVSRNILTGFGYKYNEGPSSPQSFTVSAAELTANLIITAPADYEISEFEDSGYSSSITLTPASGRINPKLIYVRLKTGLNATDYGTLANTLKISLASTGITTVNVSLIGKVFSTPLISASGGGSFCTGETITLNSTGPDIQSRYWTGPNAFYSTGVSPVLSTNATPALNGTYSVTGSVQVGGNLITNGDFESGNICFSSGYGYVAPVAGALNPEGLYTITSLARDVHNDFSSHPGHKAGTIGNFTDAASKQMVVNGAPTAGVVVWSQAVPVIPGATYQFTYSEQTVNMSQNPKNVSMLQLYVNGVAAGPVYSAPEVNNVWSTFIYNAYAGTNKVLNLQLINQSTYATGNDFALDDIVFQQILPATATTTVTVNPIIPVSVSVSALPGTSVYTNTPVTYTATPTNGGPTPSYQWKVNGVIAGTNSSTFVYTPNQGDIVSCTLASSLTCVSNNPNSSSITMTVTPRSNFWMGYVDTDWNKTENWTQYVPTTGEDVEYATVANYGVSAMKDLQLDKNRIIGSLINATTKRLLIPVNKGLTVNNTITTDGNVDRIVIYSSSTQPNGSLIFHNSENNPVSATVEMYSKASWNLSNAVNNKYKCQYFGIPLRELKLEPSFNGAYVRKWDETGTTIQNHWVQLGNNDMVYPYIGYEICQENFKTYTLKGQLVNSNFSSGQLPITASALYPGQHIFANPYTAAIDIKQLQFGASTEATVYIYNTGTFSIWDFNGQGTTRTTSNEGQYLAVPKETAGTSGLPEQIPSMQTMLVKALENTNAFLNFNYNSVVMNNTELQRAKSTDEYDDRVCTKIDVIGENYADRIWLFTHPSCTRNFDNGWDGYKIIGNSLNPQLFSVEQDGNYQVSTMDNIHNTTIAFQAGIDEEYTLKFTQQNIHKQYARMYLMDIEENKTVDITASGSIYTFYAGSTPKPVNRFKIVTRPLETEENHSLINIFNSGKIIFVDNEGAEAGNVIVYDIFGKALIKKPFTENGLTYIITNNITGAYIVRVKTEKEDFSKKIIIQ